jgi:hydroxymethylpyrimidine pyrophosphatase-like HAD family hydrolase
MQIYTDEKEKRKEKKLTKEEEIYYIQHADKLTIDYLKLRTINETGMQKILESSKFINALSALENTTFTMEDYNKINDITDLKNIFKIFFFDTTNELCLGLKNWFSDVGYLTRFVVSADQQEI